MEDWWNGTGREENTEKTKCSCFEIRKQDKKETYRWVINTAKFLRNIDEFLSNNKTLYSRGK
jgi:hypothetical protein